MNILTNYNISNVSHKGLTNSSSLKVTEVLGEVNKNIPKVLSVTAIYLAMLANVTKKDNVEEKAETTVSPLGESLENPSFPTEFNKEEFAKWAINMGLRYEWDEGNNVVLMKYDDGHIARRIVSQRRDKKKVHLDRISIYENGREVRKFVKKANEPAKFYCDNNHDGIYTYAELRSDGIWYNLEGRILQFNPITDEPQEEYVKPSAYLGESLTNPSFPKGFDVEEFEKWAKEQGLPKPVTDDSGVSFYDYEDRLVRKISERATEKGTVEKDEIYIYSNDAKDLDNDVPKVKISNYWALGGPMCFYDREVQRNKVQKKVQNEEGEVIQEEIQKEVQYRKTAQLLEKDGRLVWCEFGGSRWEQPLEENPITGKKQEF